MIRNCLRCLVYLALLCLFDLQLRDKTKHKKAGNKHKLASGLLIRALDSSCEFYLFSLAREGVVRLTKGLVLGATGIRTVLFLYVIVTATIMCGGSLSDVVTVVTLNPRSLNTRLLIVTLLEPLKVKFAFN